VSFLHLRGYSMRIDRRDLPAVAGLGVLSNTVYQFFFVSGLAQTKAGNAALIGAAAPIFAYVTGILLKREGYSHRVLAGILMSFAGVAVIVLFGSREISLGGNWKGDSMILISSLCWGFYTGAAARLILKYGAVRLTVWLMISGTIFMIPPFLPFVLRQNWHAIPPVAWLGFCYSTFLSIVYCYLIWSYALQMVGVSRTAVFSNMTPLIALVGGWLILGEDPAVAQLGGAALILTGIFIVRSRKLQAGIGVDIRRARADRSL
jgi:drug/metabolite transporter (DMT)-like permease